MFTDLPELGEFPEGWKQKHLLGLEDLTRDELNILLDQAQVFRNAFDEGRRKFSILTGSTSVTLFFENSTRTRTSFTLAAQRLGATCVAFAASTSSLSKGESIVDTARNLEAMGCESMVVRHCTPGIPHLLAKSVDCSIINAGDGAHEHPTQGLLDILTMRQHLGSLEGKTVGIVGDIAHSRVARSNAWGLKKLGAHVIVCGPSTLVSHYWEEMGVEYSHSLDAILPRVDVLNMLRIQFERQFTSPFPSIREYSLLFGMNGERLRRGKKELLVIAPGPINRGVELTPDVADGPQSAILAQVSNGLAVRMAVFWLTDGARKRLKNIQNKD